MCTRSGNGESVFVGSGWGLADEPRRSLRAAAPVLDPTELSKVVFVLEILGSDCVNFCATLFRDRRALAAENLFLRKQLSPLRSVRAITGHQSSDPTA
jgi:hypothetical protein